MKEFLDEKELEKRIKETKLLCFAGLKHPLLKIGNRKFSDLPGLQKALTNTYIRAYSWLESLSKTQKSYHCLSAAASARAIFELWIDTELLTLNINNDHYLKMYEAFPIVNRYKTAQWTVEQLHKKKRLAKDEKDIVHEKLKYLTDLEVKKEVSGLKKLWTIRGESSPTHWSGMDIESRIQIISKKYPALRGIHALIYSQLNEYIHAGPMLGYQSSYGMIDSLINYHSYSQANFLRIASICSKFFTQSNSTYRKRLLKFIAFERNGGLGN
jgi:hypothetical protein